MKFGANPNAVSNQNETPLHKAIFNPKVRVMMVQMLMKAGASANIQGGQIGDTPLHYAVRLRRKDLVEYLLAGADLTIKNNEGHDVLTLATLESQAIGGGGGDDGKRGGGSCKVSTRQEEEACYEIVKIIKQVKELNSLLDRCGLASLSRTFILEGLYDLEVLCQLTESQLAALGVNMGGRVKLKQELSAMAAELEEKKKTKGFDFIRSDFTGNLPRSPNDIRMSLNLSEDWEIGAEEIEFTGKLGSGTSGQVFKGLYQGLEVAIKVLNETSNFESELQEFKKEFEILRKVNSPYMIKFFGAVIEKNLCLVMELCDRGSLYDLLAKKKDYQSSWEHVLSFSRDMAEGISVLHNHVPPIIHRDLKSLNLLVTKDWRVKVCDFGLSRLKQGDLTTFTRLCGTYAYCAPEVFKGTSASEKSDVYSMGIVLWELLNTCMKKVYEQPFSEFKLANDFAIIIQSAEGLRPTIPEGSPMNFVRIFQKCVCETPEERPTATEVAMWLADLQMDYKINPNSFFSTKYSITPKSRRADKLVHPKTSTEVTTCFSTKLETPVFTANLDDYNPHPHSHLNPTPDLNNTHKTACDSSNWKKLSQGNKSMKDEDSVGEEPGGGGGSADCGNLLKPPRNPHTSVTKLSTPLESIHKKNVARVEVTSPGGASVKKKDSFDEEKKQIESPVRKDRKE
eukprot:TRINITY_DN4659_c0_g2_i12.p1 TRINITY_DN4659_c0_g2~~TRINITY_DN4659_c0_g2_i12.p1  ORF type:complete len:680 (-),score=174.16 TRINITY_DN4659_c0_g2_i12:695-2734(-)